MIPDAFRVTPERGGRAAEWRTLALPWLAHHVVGSSAGEPDTGVFARMVDRNIDKIGTWRLDDARVDGPEYATAAICKPDLDLQSAR